MPDSGIRRTSPEPKKDPVAKPSSRNDRATYRTVYPENYPKGLVPQFLREGDLLASPLLDCSEQGIRYRQWGANTPVHLGMIVVGELQMYEAPPRTIRGRVVRVDDDAVAVHLESPGLPFRLLLAEQRAILTWTRARGA